MAPWPRQEPPLTRTLMLLVTFRGKDSRRFLSNLGGNLDGALPFQVPPSSHRTIGVSNSCLTLFFLPFVLALAKSPVADLPAVAPHEAQYSNRQSTRPS